MHDQHLSRRLNWLNTDLPRSRKPRRRLFTLSRQDAARLGRYGRLLVELAAVALPFGVVAVFLLSL